MSNQRLRLFSLTQSLSGRFWIASLVMTAIIVFSSVVAIQALRLFAEDNRTLSRDHLISMQDSQQLMQYTMQIQYQTHLLVEVESAQLEASYQRILQLLDDVDTVVARLGHSTSGPAILDLHQVSQVFRNTIHIIARMRSNMTKTNARPEQMKQHRQALEQLKQQQDKQVETLMITAEELTSRVNFDYREAVEKLMTKNQQLQEFVIYAMAACVFIIWLLVFYFRRKTIVRLQKISFHLLQGVDGYISQPIPVKGHDEIGEMARAVEKLLEEHSRLKETHQQDKGKA